MGIRTFTTPKGHSVKIDDDRTSSIAAGNGDPGGDGYPVEIDGIPVQIVGGDTDTDGVNFADGNDETQMGHAVDALFETQNWELSEEYNPNEGGGSNPCPQCEHDPCICP